MASLVTQEVKKESTKTQEVSLKIGYSSLVSNITELILSRNLLDFERFCELKNIYRWKKS